MLDRDARAAALSEAARAADESEQPSLVAVLIDAVTSPPTVGESLLTFVRKLARRLKVRVADRATEAMFPVVKVWDLVPDEYRRAMLADRQAEIIRTAAMLATNPDPLARRASVVALRDIGSAEALPALIPFLLDREASVAVAADRAFLTVIERWIADQYTYEPSPSLQELGRAVVQAIGASAEHRSRGPLMGAILLLEPARLSLASVVRIDALSRWLTGAGPDIDALRNTIRGSRHPVARIRAWQWLARPNLASACVDRLARAHDAAEHEAVLTAMHLASNPRRSSAAVGIARRAGFGRAAPRISGGEIDSNSAAPSIAPQSAVPRPSEIPALSPRAKWGLARWVGLIDAPARIRRAVLDPLLTDHMPGVRLSAARVAMADDLADYCFDEDAAVARTSIIRWSDAGVRRTRAMPLAADRARRRLLEKLTHSPHGFVRRVARDDLAWGTPLAADPSDHAARPFNLAAVGDPTGLIPTLEQELASAPGPRAGLALRVIQRLGLASSMQDQLVALVPKPSDPPASLFENSAAELPAQSRLAASAVSTLAEVPAADRSPACIRALASALHDADDRVRANAVDGVARDARRNAADESSRAVLRELKSDPHHRVRASAVRGLIWSSTTGERRAPHGGELVIDMLGDHRPLHRLAGVWLCERWALAGAAAHDELARATGQLRGLSEHDLDPRITARATRAIRRIRVLSGHDPIAAAHREDA